MIIIITINMMMMMFMMSILNRKARIFELGKREIYIPTNVACFIGSRGIFVMPNIIKKKKKLHSVFGTIVTNNIIKLLTTKL